MKIQGPGRTQGPSGTKKTKAASSANGSFRDLVVGGSQEAATAGAAQSIAQVDALLAVQGAEDPTDRAARQQVRRRAGSLLDALERIRTAMLAGTLTVGDMVDIADVIASHRDKIADPQLTALMDEIDLRAQVELAKMRVSLDSENKA